MSKTTTFGYALFSCLSSPKPTSFISFKPVRCRCPIHQTRRLLSSIASPSPPSSDLFHVIVGPMFAGKTASLPRRIQDQGRIWSSRLDISSFQVKNVDKTLKSLCFMGRTSDAVRLLWGKALEVDCGTYALLLQECIFRKEYENGRKIHAQMVVVGHIPDEYLKTKLLILYAKSGNLKAVHVLFNGLKEKSLISWNALVAGYVQKGLEEMGLGFYYKLRQNGLTPDHYTFASVFRACAALATLEHGKQAHGVMVKCHLSENVVANSALMDMYFKCSNLADGRKVFDKSSNKNVITWTSLISGYGQHGLVTEVLELFNRMRGEGFKPNYVTFLAVLSACSHGGLVDKGWDYFLSMKKDYEIKPRGQHYAAMVDLLGRSGRLKEALEFVLSSPCREHSVVWGALIGACKIHGDMTLLKIAAEKYFELDPMNAGKHVVLSNAYATFGFWDDVAKLRGRMRNKGVTKEPAYSSIEVQREVHLFLTGDKSHRESKETHKLITELTCTLKDAGYMPDATDH